MNKKSTSKKFVAMALTSVVCMSLLTACGEPKFNENVADTLEISACNSIKVNPIPDGTTGVNAVFAADNDNISVTTDGMVTGNTEGTATLHLILTDEKGKSSVKTVAVNVKPTTAVEFGNVSMLLSGAPINDGTGATTSVGTPDNTLEYVNNAWVIKHSDADVHTYVVEDNEIANVTADGTVNVSAAGTTKIYDYTESADAKVLNGWFMVTVIEQHVHNYTSVKKDATCTEKGYTKDVCNEIDLAKGAACGDETNVKEIGALGHNYQVTGTKTEGNNKITTSKCSRCGDVKTKTEAIPQQVAAPAPAPAAPANEHNWLLVGDHEHCGRIVYEFRCTICGEEETGYNMVH